MRLSRESQKFILSFLVLLFRVTTGQIVDHMQEPGLTFSYKYDFYSDGYGLIDDDQSTYYCSDVPTIGDWIRAEFPEPVVITTVYLLYMSYQFTTGDTVFADGIKVDIYAGPNVDHTLNTLCATNVLPEGIFNCGGVLGQYVTIVMVENLRPWYMEHRNLKVFSEEEVGQYATEVTTVAGAFDSPSTWVPLHMLGNTPYSNWQFYPQIYDTGGSGIEAKIQLSNSVSIKAIVFAQGKLYVTIQVYVRNSSSGVSTICDPASHVWGSGDVVTYLCGATADEVYVKETGGSSRILLRKIAILKEPGGCDDGSSATPVSPPDMTAQVQGVLQTFEFSALTEICDIASFQLLYAPEWAYLAVDATSLDAVITLAPTSNAQAGSYTLELEMALDSYPLASPIVTTFQVTILETVNQTPTFDEELSTFQIIYKTEEAESWSYTLPPTSDPDQDPVSIFVDTGLSTFVGFSGGKLSIQDLSDEEVTEGTYTIEIVVSDGQAENPYQIKLVIKPAFVETISEPDEEVDEPIAEDEDGTATEDSSTSSSTGGSSSSGSSSQAGEDETQSDEIGGESLMSSDATFDWEAAFADLLRKRKQKEQEQGAAYVPPKAPTATIDSISDTGKVVIVFTEDMSVVPDLALIQTGSVTDGFGEQLPIFAPEVVLGAYTDETMLGYSWSVLKMTKRSLDLQIAFQNPMYISMEEEHEMLKVTFNGGSLFVSEEGMLLDLPLEREVTSDRRRRRVLQQSQTENSYLLLEKRIPKQIPAEGGHADAIQALENAAQSSKMVLLGNFLFNLSLSASLNQLWVMINTQQLIVLLPLMKVQLPANAAIFFKSIFQIAAFDFYDMNDILHQILQLEPSDPFNENFEDIGFESSYMINNMGTMIFFYIFYPLLILLEKGIRKCRKRTLCCLRFHTSLRRSLYYNAMITGLFESYAVVSICCLIQLPIMSFETYGLTIQAVVCIGFSIFIILVPVMLIKHTFSNFLTLNDSNMKDRFGAIYQDLRLKSGKVTLFQPSFFLIRRFIIAFAVVVCHQTLIAQIYLIWVQSIITVFIIELAEPYKTPAERTMERFNEIILMLVLYTMFCFTPWISDIETKLLVGYVACFLVSTHFAVNLILMSSASCKNAKSNCKVKSVKKAYAVTRKANQKRLAENHDKNVARIKAMRDKQLAEQAAAALQSWLIVPSDNIGVDKTAGLETIVEDSSDSYESSSSSNSSSSSSSSPSESDRSVMDSMTPIDQVTQVNVDNDVSNASILKLDVNEFVNEVEKIMEDKQKVQELSKVVENMSFSDLQKRTDELLKNFETPESPHELTLNRVMPDAASTTNAKRQNFFEEYTHYSKVSRKAHYNVEESKEASVKTKYHADDYYLD